MLKRIKGFTLIELLIVVAIIAILAAIAVPNFLEAQTRSKVSRVRADLRSLATGIESYFVDNNAYPAQDSSTPGTDSGYGVNDIPEATAQLRNMPTFRRKRAANDNLMTLTTPVAYITSYFSDPFANTKRATFSYSTNYFTGKQGWVIWSFGPDTDELGPNPQGSNTGGDLGVVAATAGVPPFVETSYYNPAVAPITAAMIQVTYDPTNGTTSIGDVYRLKE